jgi:hypothetical protein
MMGKNIFQTIVHEGVSTCIMSISGWKSLGSPKIYTSFTLLKSFDGHVFQPHGIITTLPIELGCKTISVSMEVINAPLEYNMLLEHTWFYKITAIVSSVFRSLHFPHQGKIIAIDQISFLTPYLGSNVGSNLPFVIDTMQSALNVGVKNTNILRLWVYSPFPHHLLLQPSPSGSLKSFNPWVVPLPQDVYLYGASMPLNLVDIFDPTIISISTDTIKHLHPHMECDHPTLPIRVFDSPHSYDFPDTNLPLEYSIMKVITLIENPKHEVMHRSSFPNSKLMRVNMMSLDPGMRAYVEASNIPPIINSFLPLFSFSKLATKFSATPPLKDFHVVLPSCLDGSHQGAFIAHKTTHNEYLWPHKFITMWHGPCMVSHMMPKSTHDFIDYEKYPFPEPSHGLYFS